MSPTSRPALAMPAIVATAAFTATGPRVDAGRLRTNRRPTHLPVVR
ncbi:MAG: hypothetical protein ACJ72B_10970 [Ornithinibacter sp.]